MPLRCFQLLRRSLLVGACIACGDDDRRTARGVVFDPARVRVGDSIAGLRVDARDVRRAGDGEWVGMVRFAGTLTVGGRTMAHPDADVATPCFEADDAGAARLPRWAGDARRSWFCFTDAGQAAAQLGATTPGRAAVIRIDSFTIHYARSDVVNSARLVRVDGGAAR